MEILVTGSSGLIGSALVAELTLAGHNVYTLSRSPTSDPKSMSWNIRRHIGDLSEIPSLDAVVHLAGESIGTKRWTSEEKAEISKSRIEGTGFLVELLDKANLHPQVFIGASAIGYYGDSEEKFLTEHSPPGTGFLASLVQSWEAQSNLAKNVAERVVILRSGMVLSSYGGALAKQLPLFRYGIGAALGSGRQYVSWIHLEDEVRAITLALTSATLSGPINLVSPGPVTNQDFARTIAKVLNRPMMLRIPTKVLQIALGTEFADELLLASQHVTPKALEDAEFRFHFPDLENALLDLLR